MNASINSMIIEKRDFAFFEDDMIRHAKLDMFQRTSHYFVGDGTLMVLQFYQQNKLPTLKTAIETQYYNKTRFVQFLRELLKLKKICDEYLLDFEKIDFCAENAYLSGDTDSIIWRYIPTFCANASGKLCDLLRQMVIETEVLTPICSMMDLRSTAMTPEHLIDIFSQSESDIKTFSLKHLLKRKRHPEEASAKPISRNSIAGNTMHASHYPMLINKANPSECYKLYFEYNTIGRESDNNIHIDYDSVSRRHAAIYKDGMKHYIKDLNSTNGTCLAGLGIDESKEIVNGDILQFGDKEFIFIR